MDLSIIVEKAHNLQNHGKTGVHLLSCYGNRMR